MRELGVGDVLILHTVSLSIRSQRTRLLSVLPTTWVRSTVHCLHSDALAQAKLGVHGMPIHPLAGMTRNVKRHLKKK